MKYVLKSFSLIIFICLSTYACFDKENQHRYIYINNNSTNNIYYRFSFAYPDTSLKNSDPNNYKVNADEQVFTSASCFAFNNTIQLFIMAASIVENEPWDTIVANNKVLKRYQFTEQLLQNDNWTITYP
jgi:hypothetical protein